MAVRRLVAGRRSEALSVTEWPVSDVDRQWIAEE